MRPLLGRSAFGGIGEPRLLHGLLYGSQRTRTNIEGNWWTPADGVEVQRRILRAAIEPLGMRPYLQEHNITPPLTHIGIFVESRSSRSGVGHLSLRLDTARPMRYGLNWNDAYDNVDSPHHRREIILDV